MRRGANVAIVDFGGGLHTTAAITEMGFDEAYDLSNGVVGPNGDFFRSRYGNTTFNSSAMNSGAAVQGIGYYKLINGNDFLVAIAGNKFFKADSLDGTMDDVTGAVTITSNQNNIWTPLTFNNVQLWFGGPATNPDAPIQYTGSGNAAALTGSPPSAYGAVQGNNRVFAFRTAASPSIVQWCILGNPQNWTGTGSGSQTISTSDNDSVTAMAVMDNSLALVFKQNSTHKLLINQLVSTAFPSFPLFPNVGCAGKHAVVVANGLCYFITPQGEMKITDGVNLIDSEVMPRLPFVNDLWSSMNTSRYEFIQGFYMKGEDYEHICWLVTSGAAATTNDWALIWDIKNKCWLRHKTGFKANVVARHQNGIIYTGHYNGIIYKQDVAAVSTDASESAANIDSYWTSGWQSFGSLQFTKFIKETFLSYRQQTLGTIQFSWGYDFNSLANTQTIDQRTTGSLIGQGQIGVNFTLGGTTDTIARLSPIGNGKVFQYRLRNNDYLMKINNMDLLLNRIGNQNFAGRS